MRSHKTNKLNSFETRLRQAYERITSNQLELPLMSASEDKRDFVDRFFDKADEIADKLVSGASHVHTPDKQYEEAPAPAQAIASGTQSYLIGPLQADDSSGRRGVVVWHVFANTTRTLCGITTQRPETFWRANNTSREALLTCFGCLSRVCGGVQSKPVLELKP